MSEGRDLHLLVVGAAAAVALILAGCDGGDDLEPAEDPAEDAEVETGDDPATDAESAGDEDGPPEVETEELEIALVNVEGQDVGTATLVDDASGVWIEIDVQNLGTEPGFRGFHVHENGECDPDDPGGAFMSAGDHYAPEADEHGAHAGDLPPLLVTEDGAANLTFRTDRFDLAEITADGGTALIVHEDMDNFGHIPDRYSSDEADAPGPDEETSGTGDAGDRIVCGVIVADDDLGEEVGDEEPEEDDEA